MPTPAGLDETMKNIVAPEDAFIVRTLREAGTIILGHTDAANAGNPFNQTLNPGGSSEGRPVAFYPACGRFEACADRRTEGQTYVCRPLRGSGRHYLNTRPCYAADYERNTRLRNELRVWFNQIVSKHGVDAVIYPTVRKLPQPRE